jgi:thiamine monophosphate synthase
MRGNKILHRRIVGDSLLNLLEATSSSSSSSNDIDAALLLLWNGYNLVEQAQKCFRNKQYEQAISLYKKGIEMALEPAQALVKSSNNEQNGMLPRQFAWLVRAYCEESEAKLQVNDDKEGALESARAACHLSKNTNAQSLTVATGDGLSIYQ